VFGQKINFFVFFAHHAPFLPRYTIGYYGRPFQTRNKVKGGAFDATESDNFRWIVGDGSAIRALDEGLYSFQ
jgi:hypothetical protein